MSTAILISIILITMVYVLWPYLFPNINVLNHEIPNDSGQLLELLESRDSLLSTIKDLEFDYDIGKLSTEDFTKMDIQYRNKAMGLFKEIELHKKDGGNERGEQPLLDPLVKNDKDICSICNNPSKKGDQYCRSCGHQLNHR